MSTNPVELRPEEFSSQVYEDEIDLRVYIDTLIAWWKEITLFAIVSALAAGLAVIGLRIVQTPSYEASATVVIASLISDVTLDDRFQTLSDDTGGSGAVTTSPSRRGSLVGLVKNSAIAEATIAELGSLLDEKEQDPARLMADIEAEAVPGPDARTPSDLIRISATADSPEKAQAIANAWAENYVKTANQIYSRIPDSMVGAVSDELEQANTRYAQTQENLEQFMIENRIGQLSRAIDERQTLVDDLQAKKLAIIQTQLNLQQREQELRFALFDKLHAAEVNSTMAVLDEQVARNQQDLAWLDEEHRRIERFRDRAQVLREQIEATGDAAVDSNALAIEMLKGQLYAAIGPVSLDVTAYGSQVVDGERLSARDQAEDMAGLVLALDAYMERLDQEIEDASETLLSGEKIAYLDRIAVDELTLPALLAQDAATESENTVADRGPLSVAISDMYAALFSSNNLADTEKNSALAVTTAAFSDEIGQLEEEIQQLRSELEAERSRERQLVQQRDLAWNAYDTVAKKLTELNLERIAINSIVRMGGLAPTPARPLRSISLRMAVPLAGMVGLMAGVFFAFLASYLGKEPFLGRSRSASAA